MGFSYSPLFGRFHICTIDYQLFLKSSNQKSKLQKQKTKQKFNNKNYKLTLKQTLFKNLPSHFPAINFAGGVLFLVIFLILMFAGANKSRAAEIDLDLAKTMMGNVVPAVSAEAPEPQNRHRDKLAEDYIVKPLVTETKITLEPKKTYVSKTTKAKSDPVAPKAINTSPQIRYFPYGYCTYYAAQRRTVTWSGNASSWLVNARAAGMATGSIPAIGAIIVTTEGGRTGHVGIVDQVNNDGTITISEMNYRGFGVISSRTIPTTYGPIRGYIY
ncbi:MAG: CHAP domain-containing protein [Patescibacteria group bacterium]